MLSLATVCMFYLAKAIIILLAQQERSSMCYLKTNHSPTVLKKKSALPIDLT